MVNDFMKSNKFIGMIQPKKLNSNQDSVTILGVWKNSKF